ncbi:homoserine kinase [Virgibacillus doumboii]|uniref:homoserine kinase n=1 Tax=Virgibacillus doumboii TaxID=2697503 RepID=UPI0013DE8B86|nr:homoserine kinase [Virgibacillus doumboii]
MKHFHISIPASSANMGPGFDSAGLALNRFLTLDVKEQEKWEFVQKNFLPSSQELADHFIYQVANQVARKHQKILPACKVTVSSEIPLARGLGSSASAILAGIELANQLCDLALTNYQKLYYGTEIEGHPDNIAPSLFGGIVITAGTQHNNVEYIQIPAPGLDVVAFIPDIELKTEAARGVLPADFPRKIATSASAMSNVMIASLLSGDYDLAGKMMESDQFHEPYRAGLIPNYQSIRQDAKKEGAFGTVISGAGPTMISFVPEGKATMICERMEAKLSDYKVAALKINHNGLQVRKKVQL